MTVNIVSYSGNTNYVTTGTSYPPSNGINSSANTTNYAIFSATSTSSGFAYYSFSSIEIPSIATINSISCTVRTRASASSSGTSSFQLFAGPTEKGSQTTVTSTSVTTYNLTSGASWTVQEINDGIFLRIGVRRASTNRAYSNRFYGATLTVNYTINDTAYTISSISNVDSVTTSPTTQEVYTNEDAIVEIHANTLDGIVVEDNGVDITNLLVESASSGGDVISSVPQSNFTTGLSSSNADFYTASSTRTTARLQDPIGHTAENPATQPSSNQWTYVKDGNQNTATGWIIFDFDFSSIPDNATITNVEVKCYGAKENVTTSATYLSKIGLYAGTTLKSTEQEFNATSPYVMTINNPGTWSRVDLQNAKLRHTVAYYGGWMGGVTWKVSYTVPTEIYWVYTITGVAIDHTVIVNEDIIVPPEEDPTKTYYSLTISSINAITDPKKGTTRVESGTGQTITITPSDPQLTLALDNGVDISNQLVPHGGESPTSALTTVQGASYGFAYCGTTGYYMSENKGVDKSAAVCKIDLDLPVRCLVTIEFINYAEQSYDFGVFGNVDVALSTDYYAAGSGGATITDTNYKLACNTSTYNISTPQTITYEIESGQHSIYIKYSKDDATSNNNDTLQFKVTSIETLEPSIGYYTYDLTNISADHSLIFIFGDVTYYFVNSTTASEAKLYPDGQMVQLPGDVYKLTIIPKNTGDTITATDNNVDITSALVRKEEIIEKGGIQQTVVNYIYTLTNIQTGHTIVVSSAALGNTPYTKINGSWTQLSAIWKKIDGRWQQQEPISIDIFDDDTIYIKED